MSKPEILAPAGNQDQLIAAVQSGCDAVYLGTGLFSARASAGNFSLDEMPAVIDYCHLYQVKVYVAINILLKETELPKAVQLATDLWQLGVDALIVTDPGLMSQLRLRPEIELHASTQTSIHHPVQAQFYHDKGITRAILARELSAPEIKAITEIMDSEIFIQGALCISYSGQCLMSSLFGGRSGNRGRCAQPCRLSYQLADGSDQTVKRHHLSPKDLAYLPKLDEIVALGVKSLKIEGRLRTPAYVQQAVTAYREALDGAKPQLRGIELTFNRGGYTQDYLTGKASHDMMAKDTPKHLGKPIGMAGRTVELTEAIQVGDGLTDGQVGFRIEEIRWQGRSVDQAEAGQVVEILPRKLMSGETLYKNLDVKLQAEAQELIRNPYGKKLERTVRVRFAVDQPIALTCDDISVQGDVVQVARSAPLSQERISQALEKSGDTPFRLVVEWDQYQPGFLPVASLNNVRRQLVERLTEATVVRREKPELQPAAPPLNRKATPDKIIIVRQANHLELLTSDDTVCLNPFYQDQGSLTKAMVESYPGPFYLHLPTILRTEYQATIDWVLKLKNCQGIVTSNVAAISQLTDLIRIGDAKLNIMNSQGADFYEVDGYVISEELNQSEIRQLKNLDLAYLTVYGRTELMLMDYCQTRTGYPCSRPCQTKPIGLVDRMGEMIPISHDIFCRSHLLNPKRKNLLGLLGQLRHDGIKQFVVELTDETVTEAKAVLEAFRQEIALDIADATYGHYRRGVE